MIQEARQRKVAYLLFGGVFAFVAGLVFLLMVVGGGAAAGARRHDFSLWGFIGVAGCVVVLGLALAGFGLFLGWRSAFGRDDKAPVVQEPNAYVVAAFVLTRKGDPVYDLDFHDPAELVRYVQLRLQDGRTVEVTTHPATFATIGEGSRGLATIQGGWLSMFQAYRG